MGNRIPHWVVLDENLIHRFHQSPSHREMEHLGADLHVRARPSRPQEFAAGDSARRA
jgi:hypothetical protein